jgi:hypothetical protein
LPKCDGNDNSIVPKWKFIFSQQNTVFPHIVSAETILFWIWKSKSHST